MRGKIRTGWKVASVKREPDGDWRIRSTSGEERRARHLVSTIPIHELLPIWEGAPAAAHEAAARLRYNSLINVVIGSNEDRGYPYTAIYVPDPDITFHRISFPCAFSERCAPRGSFLMMAEITANAGDGVWELSDETLIERTIDDLHRMGLLDRARVSYRRVMRFKYGYPVYDLSYRANVTAMREAVAATGLRLLGRFAQFDYINSDVCGIPRYSAARQGARHDPARRPAHVPAGRERRRLRLRQDDAGAVREAARRRRARRGAFLRAGEARLQHGRPLEVISIKTWPQRMADWLGDSGYLTPARP